MSEPSQEVFSPNQDRVMEILLVEDNQADIDLTREAFQDARFYSNLNVLKDGSEVLPYLRREGKYAKAKRPDLIILDLTLPTKDGRQVLEEIKSDWSLKIIPVIVMTSSDSDVDLFRSYSMGANSYVRKPLDFHQFAYGIKALGDFWFTLVKLPQSDQLEDFLHVSTTSFRSPRERVKAPVDREITDVLVVEDNEGDLDLIKEYLQEASEKFNILEATTLADAFKVITSKKIDVVLLDLTLPDSKGYETFIKFHLQYKDLPIIIHTMIDDMNFALGAMRAGAQDYLIKGEIDSRILSRVLKYAIERKEIEKDLEKLLHVSQAANESAKRSIFARDEFLSVVSHELKTPITALRMRTEMMERSWNRVPDEKRKDMIQDIKKQTERLSGTVGRLMDISRINAGHLKVEPEEFNFSDLVREVIQRQKENISEHDVQLDLRLDDSAVGSWDRLRIDQVITNLLTNALRYGEDKPILIETKKEGDKVILRVVDQGPGIPKDKLGTIFERFQRVTKKESTTGLGLGLYITQKLVETHGGDIYVDSKVGRGTTFTVELPLRTKMKKGQIQDHYAQRKDEYDQTGSRERTRDIGNSLS